jgi:Topoisomerase II-associated protein PAT1
MTQSDKDFITRIQVSQLVTQDPYADDFYAQVYGAIMRSRMGLQTQDERVLKFGSGGGIGLGLPPKGGGRRPNAMQRMEAQVERIVSNARIREQEKGLHCKSPIPIFKQIKADATRQHSIAFKGHLVKLLVEATKLPPANFSRLILEIREPHLHSPQRMPTYPKKTPCGEQVPQRRLQNLAGKLSAMPHM